MCGKVFCENCGIDVFPLDNGECPNCGEELPVDDDFGDDDEDFDDWSDDDWDDEDFDEDDEDSDL